MQFQDIKRTFDIPYYELSHYNKEVALGHKTNGKWLTISSKEYVERIRELSRALLSCGVKKGDKVAIISGNRMEWTLTDMAIMQIGAITVPVYPTITEQEYKYIFNHSEAKYCFVSDRNLYNKVVSIKNDLPKLEQIYTFDHVEGAKHWTELVKLGIGDAFEEDLEEAMSNVYQDDIATLIYTSGTTGTPKGVLLSHKNIVSNVKMSATRLKPEIENTSCISFLPLCHIFERTVSMFFQSLGLSVYFSSVETIAVDANEVKPKIMTAVPRVVEKLYNRIYSKGLSLKGLKKNIFFWALEVGKKYVPYTKNIFYLSTLFIAKKLVLSKFKDALGGNLDYIVSGSSAIDKRLIRLFTASGIILMEGYGLTETSPIIGVNVFRGKNLRVGSIGRPYDNIDVKIAPDGEIIVKGESVMQGYYKDPEKTTEAFTKDGYFMTGDIGELRDGFLFITDRKKEMFKTSGGKYIAPQHIETKLTQSRFIEFAMVVGENRKHPSVIIQPDFNFLKDWCDIKGIDVKNNEEMINNPLVKNRIKEEINNINKYLANWEKLKKFELVADQWTQNGGELTPTLKLKRRVLSEKYKNIIDGFYDDEKDKKLVELD